MNSEEHIKKQLSRAGLFLLAYELLRGAIVDAVRDFYKEPTGSAEFVVSEKYNIRVLTKAKHPYEASLLWLMEMEAIAANDVEICKELREYRNLVAHNIPNFIWSDIGIDAKKTEEAQFQVRKIDNFWGRTEAGIDPDLVGSEIDYEGIVSFRSLLLDGIIVLNEEVKES